MSHKILNGAVFIADAHENEYRNEFWQFLKKIDSGEIKASQLFLMGDMFDLLVGKVEYTCKKYEKYIKLIDSIAKKIPTFYFEGNHDFGLDNLFSHVHVVPIQKQPMQFFFPNKEQALLLHGDKYGSFLHRFYTCLIRNSFVLWTLNLLDSGFSNFISKMIEEKQHKKDICQQIGDFENIVETKIIQYQAKKGSYILEGHYHQNKQFCIDSLKYINFSSFACNQSFFIVKCSHDTEFAQMKLRGY